MSPDSHRTVELRLRAAVESAPSGLLMIDSEGRIVLVNREIERLFDYSREDLLGQSIEILVPESFRSHHPGFRAEFFKTPSVRKMGVGRELFGRRRDNSEVPVEIGLTPVATDEGMFVISSIVDISERKQAEKDRQELEDRLRHAQQLESLGRLAGGIAHDFNNVLGAIVGYAELASSEDSFGEVRRDLTHILEAASRGKDLVDQILRFSRRQKVELRPLAIARVVEQAVSLARAAIPASVRVKSAVEPALPNVMADETSVHQVVMNLATNAAHSMPDGGSMNIDVDAFYARDSFIQLHPTLREGRYARLTVSDTGIGMDTDTCKRAFEPFYTTKPPGKGSGLGLAAVHGILINHGGIAWIESEVGKGTAVHCLFPLAEPHAEPDEFPIMDVPRGNGERILYVDDEGELLVAGKRRLEGLGYEVHIAATPDEAIEKFKASPDYFHLVITDYTMPDMNGLLLAQRLMQIRPGVPILMTTGFIDTFQENVLQDAGMLKVLSKPVTRQTLAVAVRECLDAGRSDT
jgi:hypothetical protein